MDITDCKEKVKILIAEDHIRYRQAIVSLLNSDSRFQVIGETKSGDEVVSLAGLLSPDIVLMDIVLEGKNGIDATKDIKRKCPDINVIGLSLYEEHSRIDLMLSVGASAFLTKKCSIEEIKATIIGVQTDSHITSRVS